MSAFGAFLKTVEVYEREKVTEHILDYGSKLINGMNSISKDLGIQDYFEAGGFGCSPYYFTKDREGQISLPFRTLFSQEMIKEGVLMPWIALSLSHTEIELEFTLKAVKKALLIYKLALEEGIENYLVGKSIKPVFRKFN